MTTVSRSFGFRPVATMGAPFADHLRMCYVPSTDGNAIGIGDVVKHTGTSGATATQVGGVPVEGMPVVARATSGTAGQDYFGVMVGMAPVPALAYAGDTYRKASTSAIILVYTNLLTGLFEIQEDADTTPIALTDIGSNVAIALGSVSTTTGLGGMMLDSSTVNTTATLPVRLVQLASRVDNFLNTTDGGYGTYVVQFNTSLWAPNIASL